MDRSPDVAALSSQGPLSLPPEAVAEIRAALPGIADDVVSVILEEVPSYADAFVGPMGETIRGAVQVALGAFLSLANSSGGADPRTPTAPAVDGAYQLGRGEARAGRSTDALLSAYRIGARVSWRAMSARGVHAGLDADTLAGFAELVFFYIDQLSAASVAGHTDEAATTGRVRQRRLERLAHHLLSGSPADTVSAAAERVDWVPPTTLTAVIVPEAQVRPVLAATSPSTLQAVDAPGLDDGALLLVPDVHGRRRPVLLRALDARAATAGPARPWLEVRASYDRALRARRQGLTGDTDAHLAQLVLTADLDALTDLRARALAPLAELRPATIEKLAETLRCWLLLQGRRDEVAAALFVHPQTVRYRMGQLREAFGERLEDPDEVLALTIALCAPTASSDSRPDAPGTTP